MNLNVFFILQAVNLKENLVAGHTEKVFQEFYDLEARESTAKVINSLQKTVDTIGPLEALNLPIQPSMGDDRRARKQELRLKFVEKQALKKEAKILQASPVKNDDLIKLVTNAVAINMTWVSCLDSSTELAWMKKTVKVSIDFVNCKASVGNFTQRR